MAARAGALELLQWAHTNGCPMDGGVCMQSAAQTGHTPVVLYLHETLQIPFPFFIRDFASFASEGRNVRLMQWLETHNAPPHQLPVSKQAKSMMRPLGKDTHKEKCVVC